MIELNNKPIIYKTTNIVNNKIYVGQHYTSSEDGYLGSGLYLKRSIKKYGAENFKRETLEACEDNNVNEREIYWIDKLNACDQKIGYNIDKGGTGGDLISNHPNKKEICKHQSLLRTGQIAIYNKEINVEKRINKTENIPIGFVIGGKPKTKEHKEYMSRLYKGKTYENIYGSSKRADEEKIKRGNGNKGKKRTEEHKMILSVANKGKKLSDDTKHKMSINRIGKYKGRIIIYNKDLDVKKVINKDDIIPNGFIKGDRPHSKESIQKFVKSRTGHKGMCGDKNPAAVGVIIDGIKYDTIKDCCQKLNLYRQKIIKMVKLGKAELIKKEDI